MSIISSQILRGVSSRFQLMTISAYNNRMASSLSTSILPEPPKKPLNSFQEFARSKQGAEPYQNLGLAMKSYSAQWKQLRPTDKEVFLLKGKKNLEEYAKKKEEFMKLLKKNNQLEEYNKQKAMTKIKKAKLKVKKTQSMLNKPKRSVASPYSLFLQDQIGPLQKEMKGKSIQEIFKEISSRWGKLAAADKMKFKERYDVAKAQYEKDLSTWRNNLRKTERLGALVEVEEKLQRKKLNLKKIVNPEALRPKKKRKVAKKVTKKVSSKRSAKKKTAKKATKKKVAKKTAKSKKGAATKKKAAKAKK